jgi:hypothetical protein
LLALGGNLPPASSSQKGVFTRVIGYISPLLPKPREKGVEQFTWVRLVGLILKRFGQGTRPALGSYGHGDAHIFLF